MDRRSFLLSAGGASLAALASGAGFMRWQEVTPHLSYPGREEGHFLRDALALPPPSSAIETDVVILGSGIAGLTPLPSNGRPGIR